jgi:hypothetical protein
MRHGFFESISNVLGCALLFGQACGVLGPSFIVLMIEDASASPSGMSNVEYEGDSVEALDSAADVSVTIAGAKGKSISRLCRDMVSEFLPAPHPRAPACNGKPNKPT